MSRDPHLRLDDIIEACERLQSHLENLDFADFDKDLKTQDAVIRVFEIIGEAVKSLPEPCDIRYQNPVPLDRAELLRMRLRVTISDSLLLRSPINQLRKLRGAIRR